MAESKAVLSFESSGFAVVAQILADTECSKVAGDFDTFTSDEAGSRALLELDWCRNLALVLRPNREIARHLSPDSVAVQCTAFAKTPETNWLVSLHQDLSIPVRERVQNPECRGWSSKQGVLFVDSATSLSHFHSRVGGFRSGSQAAASCFAGLSNASMAR
jgi:hypothetical protein